MKYPIGSITLGAIFAVAACLFTPGTARAADLKILEPADKALVKGTVAFRIAPQDEADDQFLTNPVVSIQDETGKELLRLRCPRNQATQICTTNWDTSSFKDGIYLVTVFYKTLLRGMELRETREDLVLALRNNTVKPARFTVDLQERDHYPGDPCSLTVKVLDSRGHPMSGARVELKSEKGILDTDVDISSRSGEVLASVDSDDPQTVTVTVKVEDLPPVTKTIHFVAHP